MQIPLKDIKIPPRIRNRKTNVDDLMESMSEFGQLQPILINQNYELLAGYRRYLAAKSLGWNTIDAKIIDVRDKKKRLLIELEENQIRKNFTAEELEKAKHLLKRYQQNSFWLNLWWNFIEFLQKIFRWWG
ncbi:MAG: ParB N-terminal domain-containing protein [Leptospiraceae bacterium]|nr:ParB N-terminal domain-containing protein [Leptospiraceae bacterium]MDW7975128.1 ParB N-terminal domain-containing protein [Leptospiraceae bacterium]